MQARKKEEKKEIKDKKKNKPVKNIREKINYVLRDLTLRPYSIGMVQFGFSI